MEIKNACLLNTQQLEAICPKGGQSSREALLRLEREGENLLPQQPPPSALRRFLSQLSDPMVLILLAAAAISALLGQVTDSGIIVFVVLVNAALGMYQEGKAGKAAAALAKLHAPEARVIRDGRILSLPAAKLVTGDRVLLEAGDAAPADIRLTQCFQLRCDESSLTGESRPVEKDERPIDAKAPPAQNAQKNMVFMGCPIVYGRGQGIVTATGADSSLGHIAGMINASAQPPTPLQKRMAGLSKVLSIGVCAICALVFILSAAAGSGRLMDSFLLSVSLAVAAIPEGLVVALTLVLSLGMKRMGRRNAIIRRLSAVETLGSVQVICSDKTGTLTCNRMSVCRSTGKETLLSLAALACNNAVEEADRQLGDPTELALLRYGKKNHAPDAVPPRTGELPFDSSRKMMTTIHRHRDDVISYTKGAPERVLAGCTHYLDEKGQRQPLNAAARQDIEAQNDAMAADALRVLAFAYGRGEEKDMTFIGMLGMADPPREEAKGAVNACMKAGIKVVMVSGDHPKTAQAIGRKLGILKEKDRVMTGGELAQLNDKELKKLLPHISVFARVLPEDKLRIVRLWQELGKVTAMTGDGVNDAPALKAADIGCAMGLTGSEVSRQAGHMVLADDNFATIVSAVGEGRRIYDNIRKATGFLLSSNLAEVLSILIATLLGIRLFLPIHLLWINLVTDCFPALALGAEPGEKDLMSRAPQKSRDSIFGGGLGADILWQGAAAGILTVLSFAAGTPLGTATAMSMAFMTLTAAEMAQAFNMRDLKKSCFFLGRPNPLLYLSALGAMALNCALLYIPAAARLFSLAPLGAKDLLTSVFLGLLMIPLAELGKLLRRRARRR